MAAARKEQAEKGQGSVFESLAAAKEEKTPDGAKLKWVDDSEIGPRNPDLLVRSVHARQHCPDALMLGCYSTNTLRQTSKSLIGN